MFRSRLILFFFAVISVMLSNATARASSSYFIDLWTSDNDLPDSSVTAITQTPDGYLWIGTYNGLVRYDGVHFTTFTPENTPELKHPRIFSLFADPAGTLWINTYDGSVTSFRKGVFRNEWQRGQVIAAFFPSNHIYLATLSSGIAVGTPAGQTNIWQTLNPEHSPNASFCQDASGMIWCLLRDGRIAQISGTNTAELPDDNGLDGEKANCLTADRSGVVWAGTEKRILRWNGRRFENVTPGTSETITNVSFLFCLSATNYWAFVNNSVRHATNGKWTTVAEAWHDLLQTSPIYIGASEDQSGGVWFRAFGEGLFHASADGTLEQISSATGLPGDRVSSWFQDHEGNVWIGIDHGGLVRLRKKQFQIVAPAENSAVATVCEDAQSNVWLGTFGNGLYRWHDGRLDHFNLPEGSSRNGVFCAFPNGQNGLWLSADHEDLFLMQSNRISRYPELLHGVKSIFVDSLGRSWFGRHSQLTCLVDGKLQNFDSKNGFERRDVRAVAEDRQGNIWIGTENSVLYRFANGNIMSFKPDDASNAQAIWSVLPEDDAIWVGTFRGGLLRFANGKFTRYTSRDGLPGDIICQILDDGLGRLWFGSHKGIFYIPKKSFDAFDRGKIASLDCISYGLNDGLPSLECTGNYQPSAWRTQDGKLWFTTVKGAVMVNPAQIQLNLHPPPVTLEEYLVDEKAFPAAESISIPPGKHQLEFHFTALSFTAPDKVRFRYKLDGFDNAWVDGDGKRTAHYGPLQPGNYTFRVIACNNDGIWNETGAGMAIRQLPFFWQTWWFDVLAIASAVVFISVIVRYAATRNIQRKLERLKQQRALERERERIAQDIHDDLGSGLTQIMLQSSLARRESPEQMRSDLTQISDNARDLVRTMDEILWAVNPEHDTLDGVLTYVTKYVMEFLAAAKIRCRMDIPLQPPSITVSAEARHNLFLATKEILNNIVKHAHATEVSFRLDLQDNAFALVIKDNGAGFVPGETAPEASDLRILSGHGLRNIERRLESIGGNCTLDSEPGRGTQIKLTVPINNQRPI